MNTQSSQINYICLNKDWRHTVFDVRNKRSVTIGSNHYLVIAEIKINLRKAYRPKRSTRTKYDISELKVDEVKRGYQKVVMKKVASVQRDNLVSVDNK